MAHRIRRLRMAGISLCALLLIGAGAGFVCAQEQPARETPKEVLLLYSNDSFLPAIESVARGFRTTLQAESQASPVLYAESLDAVRFPGPEHESGFAAFLQERYSATKLDLIAAMGPQALDFITRRRAALFPDAPIVFMGINESRLNEGPLPPNVTGVVSRFDSARTVELALALQPGLKHLAVITGAADFDKEWETTARRDLRPLEAALAIDYLAALPLKDLLQKVGQLPPNSAVLYLSVFQDGTGERFVPRDVAEKISLAANAPVYSVYDTMLGYGIVGGYITSFEEMGAEAAKIALRLFEGATPESLPPNAAAASSFRVDWRELQRWGLKEANLPAGTRLQFKEPSLWARYREHVIVAVAIVLLQALLISGLLVQNRRLRRAEERLKLGEDRMSFAAESANLGLWQLDAETLQIWVTDHCRRILGLDAEGEVTQRSFITACHPHDRQQATQTCLNAIDHGTSYEQEYRVVHHDGSVRWILDRARNVVDASGKTKRLTGVVIDITERKEAEEALRESEERYRNVVETQTELICRYLPDTTLTFVNDAYCRYFGRKREELVGGKFIELIPEHSRADALAHVHMLTATRQSVTYEHQVTGKGGHRAWQQWTDHVICDSAGRVVELQGIGRDITELKKAKREIRERRKEVTHLTRIASLGELSGALAHELNQPLTAILSNAQAAQRLLARKVVDLPEVREILQDIVVDDNRASEVIRRLRVLFKKGDVQLQAIDVNEVTSEVLDLARSELLTHQVTGNFQLAPALPAVRADRIQLQQVMLNLVVNACEAMSATDPDKRELNVATACGDDGYVRVEIADRGPGVSPDAINRLFDPFFTTKVNGMGLGLSISRSIVAAHGGRLAVRNNPDCGATFVVELPTARGHSR
jgi:PAS domain S-box-containing protein